MPPPYLLLLALLSAWSHHSIAASAMKTSRSHHSYRCSGTSSFLHPPGNGMRDNYRKPLKSTQRHRPAYATRITNNHDVVGSNNTSSSSITFTYPTRCSSRDAASIIQNSTAHDGLLIITCDASGRGGGSKHDGTASILRMRHGASVLPSTTSQYAKGSEDLIDVTARRTVPSRTSSEVAAISLGIKRAVRTIPATWRKQVLILSDSEFALDKFCGGEYTFDDSATPMQRVANKRKKRKGTVASSRGRRKITQSMEDGHKRSLLSLMKDTPKGILFSKVRSSSRGIGISVNGNAADEEVDNNSSWSGIGFIDHDAADHLSSITRSFANSYEDEKKVGTSNGPEELPFRAVKSLGHEDIAWLENSDDDKTISANENEDDELSKQNDFWRTIEVVGSDARRDRQKRSQRRTEIIQDMLGPSLSRLGLFAHEVDL